MANFIEHDDHRDVHEAPITPTYNYCKNAAVLEQWVPSQNPSKWVIINTSLSLYSFITACSIIVALRENGEKPVAATLYLFWNFLTTFIWCMEAWLQFWWRSACTTSSDITTTIYNNIDCAPTSSSPLIRRDGGMVSILKNKRQYEDYDSLSYHYYYYKYGCWLWNERKQEIIEFMIAVYFLIGSFQLLWKSKIQQQDAQEELLDVAISLLAYLYACVRDLVILIRGVVVVVEV